jgi:hypothetical protein
MNLNSEIDIVETHCREAIDAAYRRGMKDVAGLPHDPAFWFDVLARIPGDPAACSTIGRLAADAAESGVCSASAVARYGVLQGSLMALPRLIAVALHDCLIHQSWSCLRRITQCTTRAEKNFEPGVCPAIDRWYRLACFRWSFRPPAPDREPRCVAAGAAP